jgi:internalin A
MKASGIDKLSTLSNLENLTLTTTDLSDYSSLKIFPDLMGITLTNSSIANALDTISGLTQLDSLKLNSTGDITKKMDISGLGKLTNLTSLSLNNAFFADLKFLPLLGKLAHLDVALENDDDVDMLASLSTINKLDMSFEKTIKNSGDMTFIAKIPNITALDLTLSSGFQDLSEISETNTPKLKSLVLRGASGESTQALPDLSNLIKISGLNSIAAESFSVADLKNLESLLKSDTNLSLSLQMDSTTSNQKDEDQALQKEFGKRYQSTLTFN